MKKYQKHIAVAVLLLVVYFVFFHKKKDLPAPPSDLDLPPNGSGYSKPDNPDMAASIGKTPALKMKRDVVLMKQPIDKTPTTAGRWYGRDRQAAIRAHYETGCTFVEGPNGTYGCF